MRRSRLLPLVSLLLLLATAAATGVLYLRARTVQELIRASLETTLAQELELPVRVGRLTISLLFGWVEARRAAVLDPETRAPFLEVERLQMRVDLWPLLRRELRVRSARLQGVQLTFSDSPRLRALALELLDRLRIRRDQARIPLELADGAVRYRAAGTTLDVEGIQLSLAWPDPEWAVAALRSRALAAVIGGRRLEGIRLEGSVRLLRDRWEVSRLQLDRGGSSLLLRGAVVNPSPEARAEFMATGVLALDELAPLLLGEEGAKGTLVVRGRLSGDRQAPAFEGTAWLRDAVVRRVGVRDAQASLVIRPERIEVGAFTGRVGGGVLTAAGAYEPATARYEGRVALDGVSLEDGLRAFGWTGPLAGRLTGSVEGTGEGRRPERLRLRLDLSARGFGLGGESRGGEARFVGRADAGILTVERLTASLGESRASAKGRVDLASRALGLAIVGDLADLARDLGPGPGIASGSRLAFSGRLTGPLSAPLFAGQVKGKGLAFGAIRLDSVEGALEAERSRLASRGLRIAWQRSVVTLSGELRAPDLWRAAGERTLIGSGQIEAPELLLGLARLESVRAAFEIKGQEVLISALSARYRGVALRAEGAITFDGRYRFATAPLSLDLARLIGSSELGGRGVLSARGAGDLSRPQLGGELALADTAFRDLPIGDGRLEFVLDRDLWRWTLGMAAGVRAQGTAPLSLAGPITAEVVAADLDLTPYLRALRRQLPFPLVVRVDGSARLSATLPGLRDLRGRIELSGLRCQAGTTPCQLRAPGSVTVEPGALRFDALDLVGQGLSVSVRGSVRPGERIDLTLAGFAPFPLLESWVPPVSYLIGTSEVRVALSGPPGRLKVTGNAELRNVTLRLGPLPLWLAVAAGTVAFSNDRVEYAVREGATAEGRLEARGASGRENGRWRHRLEFKLDKAQLEQLYDQLQIGSRWASGELALTGSLNFDTGPGLAPLRTLGGTLSVVLAGGSLSHYPGLVRIFGLLSSPAQPFRLPDLTQERMPYRRISADFTGAKGVMETKNLLLDSEVARVSGVGQVQVPERTVEMDLAVRPLQVLEGGIRKVPVLGRIMPESQGLAVVYFKLEGPWSAPKATAAPVKSLSGTVVDILLFLLRAPDRLLVPEEGSAPPREPGVHERR